MALLASTMAIGGARAAAHSPVHGRVELQLRELGERHGGVQHGDGRLGEHARDDDGLLQRASALRVRACGIPLTTRWGSAKCRAVRERSGAAWGGFGVGEVAVRCCGLPRVGDNRTEQAGQAENAPTGTAG